MKYENLISLRYYFRSRKSFKYDFLISIRMDSEESSIGKTSASNKSFDQSKCEAFGGRMLGILNDATLALMISLGHQIKLFDVMSKLPPSSSSEISLAATLNERYVREWLGAMVTGKIVDYDHENKRYSLPSEHAACLTREAGLNNVAVYTQYLALLGNVEQKIIKCFQKGGGVPYSEYPRFQELQAEETARIYDAILLDRIIPLVEGLDDRLKDGIDVLDVGCGRGHAINILARAYPNSRFVGYDLSKEGIETGKKEAEEWGLTNARFEAKNVTSINEPEKYGLVTAFDTIHDQAHPTLVLSAIHKGLQSNGGIFLMQDIAASSNVEENVGSPLGTMLYAVSTMHCMTVSLAYGGEGLGTAWGKQKAEKMLKEAGFSGTIEIKEVPGDILNYYYVARK